MKKQTKNKGITLIALVITIIVLLILASVAIATLMGDNGLLAKATTAKQSTEEEKVKEMAKTDILGYQAKNENGKVTAEQLREVLKKYFEGVPEKAEDLEDKLKDESFSLKAREEYGGDSVEVLLSDIYNGDLYDETMGGLAKKVLKVNPDASEDYEKSPYVEYNGILCRVFYNDGTHGLQIISADIKDKIPLGKSDDAVEIDFDYEDEEDSDDFKKAATSYNKAVDTLNKKAKDCMSEIDKTNGTDQNKIAIDARSLGGVATLSGGKFQGDTTTEKYPTNQSSFKDKFQNADDNYIEDAAKDTGQLQKLGLNAKNSTTWLASRDVKSNGDEETFYVRCVYQSGSLGSYSLCSIANNAIKSVGSGQSNGYRPVFLLSSNVKITGGKGTSASPYTLGL